MISGLLDVIGNAQYYIALFGVTVFVPCVIAYAFGLHRPLGHLTLRALITIMRPIAALAMMLISGIFVLIFLFFGVDIHKNGLGV